MVRVILGLFYVTQQPLWQYHEADFLSAVRSLRDEGHLPVLAADAGPDLHNETQPPLYYFVLLPFVATMDNNQVVPAGVNPPAVCEGFNTNLTSIVTTTADDNPLHGAVALGYTLRLISLLTSLVAVIFTYWAGRVLFPQKSYIALLAAALVAFEPTSVIVASEINNDNLILALGAIHLWLCARLIQARGSLLTNLLGLLVVAVLALLTKLTGWLMLGISVLLIINVLVQMSRQRASRRQKQIALGFVGFLIVAVVGIILFNIVQYDTPLGRYRGLEKLVGTTLQNLPPRHVVNMTVATLQDTFAEYLNPLRVLHPSTFMIVIYSALLVLGILAGLYGFFQVIRSRNNLLLKSFALLIVYALLIIGLVIFRSILNNGTPDFVNIMIIISPVRYYAPALPALGLICAAGFAAIQLPRLPSAGIAAGAFVAACWLAVSAAGLSVPLSNNQLRNNAVMSQAEYQALSGVTAVQATQPTDLPQVLGYQLQTQAAAGMVNLDLYVRANQPLTDNYALQTDMTSGAQTSSCRTVPVRGLYPTTRWQPNQVVVLHSQIPNCTAPLDAPIAVDIQWLKSTSNNGLASTQVVGSPVSLGTINDTLALAPSCQANIGVIGGSLKILKFNSPPTVTVQSQPVYYLPSVTWYAQSIPPDAKSRVYQLVNNDTGAQLQCAGAPRQDTYPFTKWSAGETIYFDECLMLLKPDTPKGTYTVSVGVKRTDRTYLNAVDSTRKPIDSGFIPVGTLQIQ